MLSYRHDYHAGNHADVLKHAVLIAVLDYMKQKEKPFCYIDTHAGAGRYNLQSERAQKLAEHKLGYRRIMDAEIHSLFLRRYCEEIRNYRSGQAGDTYPGSPMIAQRMLREQDRIFCFEKHPEDIRRLQKLFDRRRSRCKPEDGFMGLLSVVPPAEKRAVILTDPSYEQTQDYFRIVDTLEKALKRFATGVYLVWYPLLDKPEPQRMLKKLRQLLNVSVGLQLEVRVRAASSGGMYGSGMFIINPPWVLQELLEQGMPELLGALAQDGTADYQLQVFNAGRS